MGSFTATLALFPLFDGTGDLDAAAFFGALTEAIAAVFGVAGFVDGLAAAAFTGAAFAGALATDAFTAVALDAAVLAFGINCFAAGGLALAALVLVGPPVLADTFATAGLAVFAADALAAVVGLADFVAPAFDSAAGFRADFAATATGFALLAGLALTGLAAIFAPASAVVAPVFAVLALAPELFDALLLGVLLAEAAAVLPDFAT
ncbi:hypothetical protein [Mesorhizobium sp. BE184]|uniref:hypothetical protein n=1 Tax=Mesorhizobium sp. BE184 TaxID=2817714 RepID=UPI002860151C|nr:hypothetical protein [Mesorhizobium sp. BE184]MDR7033272.1 hypothetical protein [Mesorhizobium sp. BE184]